MKEIVGFLSTDEMFESASNIGDVHTPEGKNRMIEFLAKGLKTLTEEELARNPLADAFFIKYIFTPACANHIDFFEGGKIKPGLDNGDAIVGNAVDHFDFLLDSPELPMRLISDYTGWTYRDYSPEEKQTIHDSCARYQAKESIDQRIV